MNGSKKVQKRLTINHIWDERSFKVKKVEKAKIKVRNEDRSFLENEEKDDEKANNDGRNRIIKNKFLLEEKR
jgi:uncharacterized ubiquitin-like protein YukD